MPNHCSQKMVVEGSEYRLEEFKNFIEGGNGVIDFNKVIPMPKCLEETASPTPIDIKERQAAAKRKKETGYENWYDFCVNEWGTKWNAYNSDLEETPRRLEYRFQTVWSPADPVYNKFVENFPDLDFTISYVDEDWGFAGTMSSVSGETKLDNVDIPCDKTDDDFTALLDDLNPGWDDYLDDEEEDFEEEEIESEEDIAKRNEIVEALKEDK